MAEIGGTGPGQTLVGTDGNDIIGAVTHQALLQDADLNGTYQLSDFNLPANDNEIFAKGGNDIVYGAGGNNIMDGGSGFDMLVYHFVANRIQIDAVAALNIFETVLVEGITVDFAAGFVDNPGIPELLIEESFVQFGVTYTLTFQDTNVFASRSMIDGFESVRGTPGDDTLLGSDNGFSQVERFSGEAGDDFIDGRGGFDDASYIYDPAGIIFRFSGTATDGYGGTDTIRNIERVGGSQYADQLFGAASNDIFRPHEGADIVDGGAGFDTIDYSRDATTPGSHEFNPGIDGSVADKGVVVDLTAGTGLDGYGTTDVISNIERVIGTQYDDTIVGDLNANRLDGLAGDDNLQGKAGSDRLEGYEGDDILRGGTGNDTLNAGTGDNVLFGDAGDDYLVVYDGNNKLTGGAGKDTFFFKAGSDRNVINDFDYKNDRLDITDMGVNSLFDMLNASSGRISELDFGGGFIIDFKGVALTASQLIETIDGGFDLLEGSSANATLTGGDNSDWIKGGSGDEIIHGGNSSDRLEAGKGKDELFGGAGDDTLVTGKGTNELSGGKGEDIFVIGLGRKFDVNSILDFKIGEDKLDFLGVDLDKIAPGFRDIDLENFKVNFGKDGGLLTVLGGAFSKLGDVLNDVIATFDFEEGGKGNDTLNGGAGSDWFIGGKGDDTLNGGKGDDYLVGGKGLDTLMGGKGADTFEISKGTNKIFGGEGGDIIHVAMTKVGSSLKNIIFDFESGTDRLNFNTVELAKVAAAFGGVDLDNVKVDFGQDGGKLEIKGSFSSMGGIVNDLIGSFKFGEGTGGADVLKGGKADSWLMGGGGKDTLKGGGGKDYLEGGFGLDKLFGGKGADSLLDGDGRDTLTGGAGADAFIMADDFFFDSITDFKPDVDTLDLSVYEITHMSQISTRATENGIAVQVRGQDVVELNGVDQSAFDAQTDISGLSL